MSIVHLLRSVTNLVVGIDVLILAQHYLLVLQMQTVKYTQLPQQEL